MRRVIALAGIVVLVAILGVLAFAAAKPDTFVVKRDILVQAPPEKIYPLIEDFRRWTVWSPYEKLDPAMKRTFAGAPRGAGAVYGWESQGQAGVGRMEIVETRAPSQVSLNLDFSKPMAAHNRVDFTLEPEGAATRVTWAMHGRAPYVSKLMSVFFDMDAMIGKDFETGLAALKAQAERPT